MLTALNLVLALSAAGQIEKASELHNLAGGEVHMVHVEASVAHPKLLLVEQMGIDLLIDCDAGAIANAPTGRIGFEAALLEGTTECAIRPKMARAVRGNFSVEIVDPVSPVLGLALPDWRLYSSILLLDDQVLKSRQGAVIGFEQLLRSVDLDARFRLHLQFAIASLQRRIRNVDSAQNHFSKARTLAVESGRAEWLASIELGAGLTAIDQRDFEQASAAFVRAVSAAQAVGGHYDLAVAQNNQCLVLQHLGKLSQAGNCYQSAADAYRRAGETELRATPLFNWASVAIQLGEPDAAIDALNEARILREQGPYDRSLGNIHLQLALVHSRLAEWEPALQFSMSAVEIFDRLAEPGDQSRAYRMRSAAFRSLGADERARHYAAIAVYHAKRQKDGRYIAAALAASAQLEPLLDSALLLHQAAADAYLEAREPISALRESAAAARLLFENGRVEEAYQRWLALDDMRTDSRIPMQALHLQLGAELLAERKETAAAIVMAADASRLFHKLRNLQGELDAQLLLAQLQTRTGQIEIARVHLDTALGLHARRISNLPSPAQVSDAERQSLRLKDRLIDWYGAPGIHVNTSQWVADLAIVNQLPHWQAEASYQAHWRRYLFNLSRLQDDNLTAEAAAELFRQVEQDESQLELSFERASAASVATVEHLQGSLPARGAFLGVMQGSKRGRALWLTGSSAQFIEWNATGGLAHAPRSLLELSPESIVYVWGEAELTSSDVARVLLPTRPAVELPTVVYLVGDIGHADSLVLPRLPAAHTISGVALSPGEGRGLSGAQREVEWLRKHYQSRFLNSVPTRSKSIHFAAADVLHVAAHGWSFPKRDLASALVAELPTAQSGAIQAISAADFAVAKHPSLIILNACEAAGSQDSGRPWTMARELARKLLTAVIAPDDLVDDRAALQFSRTLHRALDDHDLLTAYAQAVREFRQQAGRNGVMPWRLLWAGGLPPVVTTIGEFASSSQ